MASPGTIAVRSLSGREFDREHVYFAFASGRFGYDCVSCGATCCRGYGYNIQRGVELTFHLRSKPSVMLFAERTEHADGPHFHVANWPPGCFFLDTEGRCSLQRDHGYAAKPETCRLFPFNQIIAVHGYLVVAPHPSLCPLATVPWSGTSDQSNHASLFQQMADGGVQSDVAPAIPLVADGGRLIAFERSLIDLAESELPDADLVGFARRQIWWTRRLCPGTDVSKSGPSDVLESVALMCQALGVVPQIAVPSDPSIARTLIASTAAIRSRLLFRSQTTPGDVSFERAPYACLALSLLVNIARDAGMTAVTYQTISRIFALYRSLIALLANLDCVMALRPAAILNLAFAGGCDLQERYVRLVRDLLWSRQRKTAASLGELLCHHAPTDHADRLFFLKQVATTLLDRLCWFGDAEAAHGATTRSRLQQWAIGALTDDLLMTAVQRMAAGR